MNRESWIAWIRKHWVWSVNVWLLHCMKLRSVIASLYCMKLQRYVFFYFVTLHNCDIFSTQMIFTRGPWFSRRPSGLGRTERYHITALFCSLIFYSHPFQTGWTLPFWKIMLADWRRETRQDPQRPLNRQFSPPRACVVIFNMLRLIFEGMSMVFSCGSALTFCFQVWHWWTSCSPPSARTSTRASVGWSTTSWWCTIHHAGHRGGVYCTRFRIKKLGC